VLDSKVDELRDADYRKPAHDPELSAGDAEQRRVLKLILYDALASEAMGTLTTGVFLVGFAVALGAGNFAIGILAAVPFSVQLLQIPAVLLVERWRVRRDICVLSTAVGRAFLLGAAAAPFLGGSFAVLALIVSLAIYQAMAAVAGCAWNSWMRDLVPSTQYGRFFGQRTAATFCAIFSWRRGGQCTACLARQACCVWFVCHNGFHVRDNTTLPRSTVLSGAISTSSTDWSQSPASNFWN
jgi:hypothetical protein